MKSISIFTLLLLATISSFAQSITILAARNLGVGATVTIKGIVTNGGELGSIRYIQDCTAGIAAYGSTLNSVNRGDSIQITGVLKNYNQLLEIDPVSSFTVLSTGNTLPSPELVVPDSLIEAREGELVRINNATFTTTPGGTFSSNSSYNFTANGQTSVIYVRSNHPLIGSIIPMGPVALVGIVSQFSYTSATSGYQLLCRDTNDIITNNAIMINSLISETNISQDSITIQWTTNLPGTTALNYGGTPNLGTSISDTNATTSHQITLTGLTPSQLVYVRAFSVAGSDTAFANIRPFITQSTSSGSVISYFNHPVDHSVSSGTDAIFLSNAIDDTLIAYINRAKTSIDFSIYNFDDSGISSIASALNAAYNRGVVVRVIFDGSANNAGIQNIVSGIKKIGSFQGADYTIMHNKFVVIDANHSDPNVPIVWTGSTNLTDGQINLDPNSVIIIQDKSLAITYTLEFNEMFGSETAIPDMANAKFGIFKTDNTPHKFIINGKAVECYFSPSDGTNDKLLNTIADAQHNINVATMLITRTDIAYAFQDAVNNNTVDLNILVNHENDCNTTVWSILSTLIGNDLQDDRDFAGIMHHKFMIVDEGTNSSPTLFVGTHNWSNAANNSNDENTLIFKDNQELANIYYQAFKYRFDICKYASIDESDVKNRMKCYPNPSDGLLQIDFNSQKSETIQIEIMDLSGRMIKNETRLAQVGNNTYSLQTNELSKGSYLLQMIANGTKYAQLIIIN
jgi:phosphatidylserine/phosphatidylglycerophosphate/cardiolipin synthase-like enzyme